MGLFSNISAMSHPLFRGISKQAKTLRSARRPLREFLGPSEHSLEHQKDLATEQYIRKTTARMKKDGINPHDDYFA